MQLLYVQVTVTLAAKLLDYSKKYAAIGKQSPLHQQTRVTSGKCLNREVSQIL